MRNLLAVVPRGNAEMVAAAIRTVFAQPDASQLRQGVVRQQMELLWKLD